MVLPTQLQPVNKTTFTDLTGLSENGGWGIGNGSTAYHMNDTGTQLILPTAQGGNFFYPIGYRYNSGNRISGMSFIEAKLAICDGVGMGMGMDVGQGVYFGIFANPDNTGFYCKMWFGASKETKFLRDSTLTNIKRSLNYVEKKLPSKLSQNSFYNFKMMVTRQGWVVGVEYVGNSNVFYPLVELPMYTLVKYSNVISGIPNSGVHGAWATTGYSTGSIGKISQLAVYSWPAIGYPYQNTTVFSDNFNRTSSTYNASATALVQPSLWSTKTTTSTNISLNGSYCVIGSANTNNETILTSYTENPITPDGCGGPDGTGTYIQWKHVSGSYVIYIDGFTYIEVNSSNAGATDLAYIHTGGSDGKGGTTNITGVGTYSVSTYPYMKFQIEFYSSFDANTGNFPVSGQPTMTGVTDYAKKLVLYQSNNGSTWLASYTFDNQGEELQFNTIGLGRPSTAYNSSGQIDDISIVKFPSYDPNLLNYPMQSNSYYVKQSDTQTIMKTYVGYNAAANNIYRTADSYLGADKAYTSIEAG